MLFCSFREMVSQIIFLMSSKFLLGDRRIHLASSQAANRREMGTLPRAGEGHSE